MSTAPQAPFTNHLPHIERGTHHDAQSLQCGFAFGETVVRAQIAADRRRYLASVKLNFRVVRLSNRAPSRDSSRVTDLLAIACESPS